MATACRIEDFVPPSYDPFSADEINFGAADDPYPLIHQLRAKAPVHEGDYRALYGLPSPPYPGRRKFIIVGTAEVNEALTDQTRFSNAAYEANLAVEPESRREQARRGRRRRRADAPHHEHDLDRSRSLPRAWWQDHLLSRHGRPDDRLQGHDRLCRCAPEPLRHGHRILAGNAAARLGESRPLCPYPGYARYDGKGDPKQASSYGCTSGG